MVKLTLETLDDARQTVNPVRDRELDLRGFKIPIIENLGATMNQFDTIDFTDNDIKRLENIPALPRLKCLIFHGNRISYIDPEQGKAIKNLEWLLLTNNNLEELGDLDALANFPKLEYLCLMGNPVTKKQHYRLYVIWKLPQVRVLDYRRIRLREREAAKELFKGTKGAALQSELGKKTFTPVDVPEASNGASAHVVPGSRPQEEVDRIKEAIAGASSLQEMERIQLMLESGQIPGMDLPPKTTTASNGMEIEEEDEEDSQRMNT